MKAAFIVLAYVASASTVQVTPVQKVIELMQGMLEKGIKEKQAEEIAFVQRKAFCDDESTTKQRDIKVEAEDMEGLAAMIEKDGTTAEALLRHMGVLDEDEATWSGDMKAAKKVREIEKADYETTHRDYSESISALSNAIDVLKKQSHDRKQAAALLQMSSSYKAFQRESLIPDKAKRAINLFLLQDDEVAMGDDVGLSVRAPEANAYEFQSQGIVDMFEQLLDKILDERTTLEKEETESQHAYDMLMQDLTTQIKNAQKENSEDSTKRSSRLSRKADEEGDRSQVSDEKDMDSNYLHDLVVNCDMEAKDFEARQQLRSEEAAAIQKAIDILGGGAVAGAEEKHRALIQTAKAKATSLSQINTMHFRANSNTNLNAQLQSRVAVFLKTRAKTLDSLILAKAAARISEDPFGKVKKMIKDLLTRLMEEANEEAEHKGWCDTELGTNGHTRKAKTEAVEVLNAEIDELSSSIAKLTESIAALTGSIADLDNAMTEQSKLRTEEKTKNQETIKDAVEAQTAVAQADTVLKEFYAKAAEATAFVQTKAPFQGNQDAGASVLSMIEVIQSDFANLETDTQSAEVTAAKEFDEFMKNSKLDKVKKEKHVEHKTAKKQDEEQLLTAKKADLEGTQKELDAALRYFDKLKPSCVAEPESYEDRVAKRAEEIQSMKEALKIIDGA